MKIKIKYCVYVSVHGTNISYCMSFYFDSKFLILTLVFTSKTLHVSFHLYCLIGNHLTTAFSTFRVHMSIFLFIYNNLKFFRQSMFLL